MLLKAKDALLLVIDMQEHLLPVIAGREEVQCNCAILMQAARLVGMPVLVTEQYPKGLGHTVAELAGLVEPADILSKVEFSCASNADVMARLDASGRKQLVLCGVEAHICVLQSAIELAGRGYDVFVAGDAVGSRRAPSKEAARDRLFSAGIGVVTTEMAVFEWAATASSPHFKQLTKQIQ